MSLLETKYSFLWSNLGVFYSSTTSSCTELSLNDYASSLTKGRGGAVLGIGFLLLIGPNTGKALAVTSTFVPTFI